MDMHNEVNIFVFGFILGATAMFLMFLMSLNYFISTWTDTDKIMVKIEDRIEKECITWEYLGTEKKDEVLIVSFKCN